MQITSAAIYAQSVYLHGIGNLDQIKKSILKTLSEHKASTGGTGDITKSEDTLKSKTKVSELSTSLNRATGGINIIFLGETHGLASDLARANSYIATAHNVLQADLLITERGLPYATTNFNGTVVTENTITTLPGLNFSAALNWMQRSAIVAGYMAQCVGEGNSTDNDTILVLFGENHHNICDYFEYFYTHTYGSSRPRSYFIIRSNDSDIKITGGKRVKSI